MVPTDEQLFLRSRRHGDAAALGELFDRTAPTLLRVAVHLCRDPAAAEDLLQATFLRAMEARDQWDAERPLLPWLCGVLHNRARQQRWECGRNPDPARLPASPPEDPAAAAARAEFDAAIDEAIAGLPEAYRPVLRLHLAYGHAPAEIAHALERPPGTVRSQLARGLELLRKVLPAGFAGGAALLLASGRGLAAVRTVVLGHATAIAPVAATGALFLGAAMGKKLVVAAAVAVFAATAWFVWPKPEAPAVAGVPKAPGPVAMGAAGAADGAAAGAAAPRADQRIDATARATASTGALRIRCTYADDRAPARGVQVTVLPLDAEDGSMQQRTVRTADDGSVLVGELPAGQTSVAADRGGRQFVAVVAGGTRDVALEIPAGLAVRGRVVDDAGTPMAHAGVWLSNHKNSPYDGGLLTETDQAGRFELRSVEPGRFVSALLAGHRVASPQYLDGKAGDVVEVELVLAGVGATLFGKVLAPGGKPAAAARVYVGTRSNLPRWNPQILAAIRPPQDLVTAADGTFVAPGLKPGGKVTLWVRARGSCVSNQQVDLAAEGDSTVQVQLQEGAALSGRVTDAGGAPIAGVSVDYRSTAWYRGQADFFVSDTSPPWAHFGARTDLEGRYRIDCITPGTLLLRADKGKLEVRGELQVAAGETASWSPVLVEIAIRGRVVDERGAALAGVEVTAMPPQGKGNMAVEHTDAEGRFVCAGLASVPHQLICYSPGDELRAAPAAIRFGVQPGGDELLVRLPDCKLATAEVTGRLLDTDGLPAPKARVICTGEASQWQPIVDVDAATGAFRLGPLPPGNYRVQGMIGEGPATRLSGWGEPFAVLAGGHHDLGVLQMPATGSILVTARGPDGQPLDKVLVVFEQSSGWQETSWGFRELDHGQIKLEHIAPGSYRIRLSPTPSTAGNFWPVTVVAGQQAAVECAVGKGIGVELVYAATSEPVPLGFELAWTRDGVPFERYRERRDAAAELRLPQRLLAGSWEVAITSETGKSVTTRFVLADGEPDGRRIAIRMP